MIPKKTFPHHHTIVQQAPGDRYELAKKMEEGKKDI